MADTAHLLQHVQDAYYFEVPRALWSPSFESRDAVPEFLRKSHPDWSLEQYQNYLAGKVLIPQPFGTLKNLHEKEAGFAISKFMVIELVAAVLVCAVFIPLARKVRPDGPVRGRFWNMWEAMLLFFRDEVARPAIGKHDADSFLPFVWSIFFFVLFCNLMGMIPWMGTPTGALAVTGTLAAITLLTVIGSGMKKLGAVGFWKAQVPHMDLPGPLSILLVPMIFAIEVMGLFIKHTVLAVRLLANMFAGHVVLAVIVGFIAQTAGMAIWYGVTPVSLFGAMALSMLELFVAFLQAYIFAFLAALFIGMAVHPH